MSLTFQSEKPDTVRALLEPLFAQHWKENANHRDKVKLDVDWDAYEVMAAKEILHVLTARTDGGQLVGYYISNVLPHPHYKSTLYSFNDIYYLLPEYRFGANGIRLFMEYEKSMRQLMLERGQKQMVLIGRARLAHNPAPIMKELGWEAAEMCFTRLIEA